MEPEGRLQWRFFQSWREADGEGALRDYGVPHRFDDFDTATRAWRSASVGRMWVKSHMVDAEISDLTEWRMTNEEGLARSEFVRVVAPVDREFVTMPEGVRARLREAFLSVGKEAA